MAWVSIKGTFYCWGRTLLAPYLKVAAFLEPGGRSQSQWLGFYLATALSEECFWCARQLRLGQCFMVSIVGALRRLSDLPSIEPCICGHSCSAYRLLESWQGISLPCALASQLFCTLVQRAFRLVKEPLESWELSGLFLVSVACTKHLPPKTNLPVDRWKPQNRHEHFDRSL